MRKARYFVGVFLCSLFLIACQTRTESYDDTEQVEMTETTEEVIEEATEESSDVDMADGPATQMKTGSIVMKDPAGYKVEIAFEVSQLIKGTDVEKLNQEWRYFGEDGEFEDLGLPANTTAYVIGTISYINRTEGGFDLTSLHPDTKKVWLNVKSDAKLPMSNAVMMYSTPSYGLESDMLFIVPEIKRDTWGPVTFVLGVEGFFSPADPDGAAALQNAHLDLMLYGEKDSLTGAFEESGESAILLTPSW